jgi:thiol-disulfide isomerase/thioredoxin
MRVMTAFTIVGTAGAAGLAAGGAYYYFASTKNGAISAVPVSTEAGESGRSFVMHETPQPVPDLSFVNGDGREMLLADFRGRTILLNIWATWCVPCRKEMPALDRLQAQLGSAKFEVVPLSIDRKGLPTVDAFYKEFSLRALGIYLDTSGKAVRRLGALGIPTTMLINSDGLETGRLVGPAEWDSPEMIEIIQRQFKKTPQGPAKHSYRTEGATNVSSSRFQRSVQAAVEIPSWADGRPKINSTSTYGQKG